MPTEPFQDLLYRDYAKVAAKEIIEVASPLLQELVNFGTNAFVRCQAESAGGEEDEHVPVLMSYMHILEMTDGVEVLVSQSCASPTVPLLRSSFEALLAMDYILDADYRNRAYSWMVRYIHDRIAIYERANPDTTQGRDFIKAIANDKVTKHFDLPATVDVKAAAENLRNLLAKPRYEPIEREYQALKKQRGRSPNWFNLFGGPSDLRQFARRLGRAAEYDILYRQWSKVAHGTDFSRFLASTSAGTPGIYPLRNAEQLAQVAFFASAHLLQATRLLIRKFRPGEDLARWYKTEIRERFIWLQRTKVRIEAI